MSASIVPEPDDEPDEPDEPDEIDAELIGWSPELAADAAAFDAAVSRYHWVHAPVLRPVVTITQIRPWRSRVRRALRVTGRALALVAAVVWSVVAWATTEATWGARRIFAFWLSLAVYDGTSFARMVGRILGTAAGAALLAYIAAVRGPWWALPAVLGALLLILVAAGMTAPVDEHEPDTADQTPLYGALTVDDTLPGAPGPWPLLRGGAVDVRRDGLPLGESTAGVARLVLDRHVLVAGTTGSGKSKTFLRSIALGALADPRAEVHVWSAKSTADYADLQEACASFGGGPGQMGALAEVLERLVRELPRREAAGGRPCVVVVDELHHALSHHEFGTRITAAFTALAELSRSAGVALVAGVQRPTKASIPLRIAEQLEVRIGCRVRTPGESRVLFGEDAGDEITPHLLPPDRPGLAWVDGAGPVPVLVAGWLVTPAQAAGVVTGARARRPLNEPLALPAPEPETAEPEPMAATERPAEPVSTGCAVCGADLPDDGDPGRRYCSRACQQRAYRERRKGS